MCREIITCTRQLVVAAVAGNAGAGGVMLALGADRVLLRDGVVLNPHYRTMGLYGSEYWTYVLPRRVGRPQRRSADRRCLPIGAAEAVRIGLADEVLPGDRARSTAAVLTSTRPARRGPTTAALAGGQARRAAPPTSAPAAGGLPRARSSPR